MAVFCLSDRNVGEFSDIKHSAKINFSYPTIFNMELVLFIRSPVVLLRCCGGRLLGKKIKFIPRSFVSKQVINAEMVLVSCSRKDCEEKTCGVVNDWFLD